MGQRHVCTFRHAQRAAYRTAISAAAQILVILFLLPLPAARKNWACHAVGPSRTGDWPRARWTCGTSAGTSRGSTEAARHSPTSVPAQPVARRSAGRTATAAGLDCGDLPLSGPTKRHGYFELTMVMERYTGCAEKEGPKYFANFSRTMDQWCGLRPSVFGQDRSQTKKNRYWSCTLWSVWQIKPQCGRLSQLSWLLGAL